MSVYNAAIVVISLCFLGVAVLCALVVRDEWKRNE